MKSEPRKNPKFPPIKTGKRGKVIQALMRRMMTKAKIPRKKAGSIAQRVLKRRLILEVSVKSFAADTRSERKTGVNMEFMPHRKRTANGTKTGSEAETNTGTDAVNEMTEKAVTVGAGQSVGTAVTEASAPREMVGLKESAAAAGETNQ